MNDIRDYMPQIRFSDRVGDYQRYRPGYPRELTDWLVRSAGLKAGDPIADVGAGTGLFTRDLLQAGLRVFGVEPNGPMREVAISQFADDDHFVAVNGSAEHTCLPDASQRMIAAAQAFHWFDPAATRMEFARILQPGCGVALIWNVRRIEGAFAEAYEQLLLKHCADYALGVPVQADPGTVAAFFAPAVAVSQCFASSQRFDYEGLRGRLLSSSYTPKADDPARQSMLEDLRKLFDTHAEAGHVNFEYDARVFFGLL